MFRPKIIWKLLFKFAIQWAPWCSGEAMDYVSFCSNCPGRTPFNNWARSRSFDLSNDLWLTDGVMKDLLPVQHRPSSHIAHTIILPPVNQVRSNRSILAHRNNSSKIGHLDFSYGILIKPTQCWYHCQAYYSLL